ncbi:SDR family oxidoreductase [Massilia antarctica]|uniref:SDR family oxidoreductase n=1 Tax=Massilia antarctica TaxID=2765360 RepID=UPI0006BB54B7|nr:SDR family oxidoreductase [Massilia sp. H27-R4]MCY0912421.1 SDR family oxidoreductase [Massilia sp. H27-R4]CUI03403.1 Short-chain dehydrogenase/reductase SDR [Janthinobacterium sp. CG23_2]CUU27189.1 Short-chain dehydrogenase/reductase SDR [Janthinobacterium sp. CG23_2]
MRVIVITGSSDGIGAEMARQLAARGGAKVALVLAARNGAMLDAVAGQCQSLGAQTLCVPTDVSMQAECIALIEAAVARFGRIDALINNAGRSAHARFEDVQDLGWYEDLMRVNLWGSVWCTHAALAHLKAAHGSIVAVSSLSGLVGVPGRSAYAATKFAMAGFFEVLRAELKDAGVSVTTAYPGVVATQIRHHGYNAAGGQLGKSLLKEEGAMSVEECARLIVDGMDGRQREVVMTAKGKLGRFLKLIAPGMVERMALAAVKEQ